MKSPNPIKTNRLKSNAHYIALAGNSYSKLLKDKRLARGFSLLEMMICLAIVGVMTGFGVSLFNRQIAELQLRRVVHAFIQDAQLSRQYSRSKNVEMTMRPIQGNDWGEGWQIQESYFGKNHQTMPTPLKIYSLKSNQLKGLIHIPEDLLKPSQQFTDMSTPQKIRHLSFKNGQMALLKNGGFVANRIIWQHTQYPDLIRHIILGPGGRWRTCNPKEDNQACSSN
jgi:type IV fimbrial biogenesis protein FimT